MYRTQWDLASAHVTDLQPILKTIGARGIRLDKDKLQAFNLRLDKEMAALQAQFDADPSLQQFRGFHPKEGYKRVPKDTTGLVEIMACTVGAVECEEGHGRVDGRCQMLGRWAKLKPFLATSSQQVLAYIKAQGHKVPTVKDPDEEGGKKETTGAKALALLWRRHDDNHYRDFVTMRRLRKLRGTYGEWPLTERDGEFYVTTTFTLKPDTTRLSSVNPNIQNIPKGK